ncbi:MAG: hypothetical protein ACI90V_012618, partial [Bacillariaceae sp.]
MERFPFAVMELFLHRLMNTEYYFFFFDVIMDY